MISINRQAELEGRHSQAELGNETSVTKTISTAILIMCIGIPLSTDTLAVSPIGNIQHFIVM